jgi:capsid portal protein
VAKLRKVALSVADVPAPEGETTQPTDEGDVWTPDSAINPPANLDHLASLTQSSRVRRSCIAAIAQNTVGLGYELRVRDGHEEDVTDVADDTRAAVARLDALAQRDKRLKRPSFTRLMRAVSWDKYECGNGYLEVARNKLDGHISGLFHVPGKRIRRLADGSGWIMLTKASSTTGAIKFYDFGAKVIYDDNGQPTDRLQGGSGARWKTNELIPFQLYTSESREYGLPPDAQLASDYLGDRYAADANVGFFDSGGVPPTVIFVQGETETDDNGDIRVEVPPEVVKQVADTMRGEGSAQRSRVAIIGLPAGFSTEQHDLAVLSERDMGFISFRSDNRRATLGAFRLSPVFVADIEDAGKYTAEVERAITKEQVFDPEQQEVEETLGLTLVTELFPHLTLKFDGMRVSDDVAQRQSANDLADRGRLTNGEYRAAHGYAPLPEATDGQEPQAGEMPAGWNDELVPAGLLTGPAPGQTDGTPLAKSADALAGGVAGEFDDAVADALHRVREMSDHEFAPDAVVVTKEGNSIRIEPYSGNGTGE